MGWAGLRAISRCLYLAGHRAPSSAPGAFRNKPLTPVHWSVRWSHPPSTPPHHPHPQTPAFWAGRISGHDPRPCRHCIRRYGRDVDGGCCTLRQYLAVWQGPRTSPAKLGRGGTCARGTPTASLAHSQSNAKGHVPPSQVNLIFCCAALPVLLLCKRYHFLWLCRSLPQAPAVTCQALKMVWAGMADLGGILYLACTS